MIIIILNKYLKKIYISSPIFIQNLGFSFGGLPIVFQRKMNGYYSKYLNYLRKTQTFSKREINDLQNDNIRKIINYSYNNIPYYHDLFKSLKLLPEDIKDIDDLKKLPIISKNDVRKNFDQFIPKQFNQFKTVKASTNGSTGIPLELLWEKNSILIERCYQDRHIEWGGAKISDRIAYFGSSHFLISEYQKKPPFWRHSHTAGIVYFSPFHLSENNLKYYIKKLQTFQPKIIRGHPSKIYIIADYMFRQNKSNVNPKCVITSSEMLLPYQREIIEKVFNCKILDFYGNNEHVSLITQCKHGSYHINPEYGYIEILKDGEEVKTKETGEMICTGFTNHAMPLIRYNIEDLAKISQDTCECGINFSIVESIQGRIRDIIKTKDGHYYTTGDIISGIKNFKSIVEWQLIQKKIDKFIVNVKIDTNFDCSKDISSLEILLRKRLKDSVIEINIVDHIERKNNKFRAVISEIEN